MTSKKSLYIKGFSLNYQKTPINIKNRWEEQRFTKTSKYAMMLS